MRWKKQKCLKLKPTRIMSCSTFWNNDQHAAQSLHFSLQFPGNTGMASFICNLPQLSPAVVFDMSEQNMCGAEQNLGGKHW